MTDDEGSGEGSTGGALAPIRHVLSALGRAFGPASTWGVRQRNCPECGASIVVEHHPESSTYCPDCVMDVLVDSPTRDA